MRVVIDCNIVVLGTVKFDLDAVSVLARVRDDKDHSIVLDFEECVSGEYRGNAGGSEFFQKWFKAVTTEKAPCWSAGKLSNLHRKRLRGLGFHEPSDHVYVALADETDHYIVTQDSDFGKSGNPARDNTAALDYMTGIMGLTVHNAVEACATL